MEHDQVTTSAPTTVRSTVTAAADALAGVAWRDVPDEELVATMVELERVQALLDHARLEVARLLDETDAAAPYGWASAKDFLTAVAGGRKGAGSGLVRLAARLEDLPATREAMAQGALSRAKAEVIARNVARLPRVPELRAAAEKSLLAAARDLDATDLDHAFGGIVADLDPDGSLLGSELELPRRERAAHAQRFLAFTPDALGGVRVRGYATVEDVELVRATLLPLSAPAHTEPGACGGALGDAGDRASRRPCPDPACAHDGRDPREFGARLWDALVEACRRLQTTDTLPNAHGATPRVVVTMDLEALRERLATTGAAQATGRTPAGADLSAQAARRLACDAEVIPAVLGTRSQVLDLGRSERLVTPGLWQALVLRDGHCAFPGCTRLPLACDAHHIIHWVDGGVTALDNLVLLCRRHHTLTHHSPWTVTLDPHLRRPVWTPPPRGDDSSRFTYLLPRAA